MIAVAAPHPSGPTFGGMGWIRVGLGRGWILGAVALVAGSIAGIGALIGFDAPATWGLATVALIAACDVRTRRIPTPLVWAGALGCMAAALATAPDALLPGLIGAGAGLLGFGAIWFLAPGGFGFGDVRLAALVGLVLGVEHGVLTALAGLLVSPLLAVPMLLIGRWMRPVPGTTERAASVPFGVALAASAVAFTVGGSDLSMAILAP